jgi:hypothetical protein
VESASIYVMAKIKEEAGPSPDQIKGGELSVWEIRIKNTDKMKGPQKWPII